MPHPIQAEVRLSRLVVSGFRCLAGFDLRLEPATTVLVGENNCGKTSVLLAIDTAIGRRRATMDDLHRAADDSVVPLATIDIFISPPQASAVFSDEMRRRLGGVQREPIGGAEVVGIRTTLRRSGEGALLSSTRVFLQPAGTEWVESPSPTVQQQALDLLAAHLLDSSRDLLEEMGVQTSAWGRVLSDLRIPELPDDEHGVPAPGGLKAIEVQLSELAAQVRLASPVLSQLHSDLGSMAATQATVERVDLVPIPQRVEDLGKTIEVVLHQQNAAGLPLRFHGSGSRSLAALLVFKTLCSLRVGADKGIRPHLVTLLEEPEAHLHPQAVAALLGTINSIPGQRIVSTHSATMVAEAPPPSVRLLRRTSAGLTVHTLTAGDAGDMEHFRRYFGRPFGELAFARVAVICDGIAECNAYPVLLEMALGVSLSAHGVSFVDAQSLGDSDRVNKWLRVLHSLGIPWLYCADNDQPGDDALAKTIDPVTRQPLTRAHSCVASLQGTRQTEKMLIDAGFQAEITAIALEDGVTANDDAARLNFLKRNKPWANEAVARRAKAAGRTSPTQLAEVVSKLRLVLGLGVTLPTQAPASAPAPEIAAAGSASIASTAPPAATADLESSRSSASRLRPHRQVPTMSESLSLTAEQQAAVDSTDRRILLLAPAGSGKTEVLARRMERLLNSSPGEAFRLLGVTYTVKAAGELRNRVMSAVSSEAWRVDCNTLHAFALEILQRYGATVGVGPSVVVFSDDTDRVRVISDYLQTLGHAPANASGDTIRLVLSAIDEARTRRPRQPLPDTRYEDLNAALPELYEAYLTGLAASNGIDFPGMLSKLLEALEADPWIVENFQKTYSHVFVDEAQDLTPAQTAVLSRLVGETVSVFAVADERQSINAYAGGAFANAQSLVGAGAKVLHLPHNFRCSRAILDAAERVAANLSTTQRAPDGADAPPGQFAVTAEANVAEEASSVQVWIDHLISNGLDVNTIAPGEDPRVAPEEIAVIARARWHLDAVIQQLRKHGVAVSMNLDASGFLARPEARLFFEALSTIADPSDQPARRRFNDELAVVAQAKESGTALELFSAVAALDSAESEAAKAIASHLRRPVGTPDDLDEFFSSLGPQFQLAPWSEDAAELQRVWESYRVSVNMPRRSLKGFIRFVAQLQVAKPSDPGVRILTIHRVKGLEFKAVAIVGAYNGALPDYRAKSQAALQEERRSLYVAMTRAKRSLRISWPRITEDRWGRVHAQQPSQFLTESGLLSK